MGKMTLSKLQKEQYQEIKNAFLDSKNSMISISDADYIRLNEVLNLLGSLGYIKNLGVDNCNMFELVGRFEDFEVWHKDRVREERKLSRRDLIVALISGISTVTATELIRLMIKIISWIGGK